MGFLDALLGRSRTAKPAKRDRLFAMSTAYVTLQVEHGVETAGKAGIVFQPLATSDFNAIVQETEEVLRATGKETGTTVDTHEDKWGYRWAVLADPDVEDLVVGVNAVKDALDTSGYGDRVLAAVFPFRDERGRQVLFIYNVKRATYYPFVAEPGSDQSRNSEEELRLKARFERDLPMEQDLGRWFPLWGAPL
jgi:hypothetical protein